MRPRDKICCHRIPSFQCFVIVEKDVPKEHLDRLHNLVAAVFLLERQ